jgi:hypothetical protein
MCHGRRNIVHDLLRPTFSVLEIHAAQNGTEPWPNYTPDQASDKGCAICNNRASVVYVPGKELAMKAVFMALALTVAFLNPAQAGVPKLSECVFFTHAECQWTGRIPQATVVAPIVTRTCFATGNIPRLPCECTVGGSTKDKQGNIVLKLFKVQGVTKCVRF